MAEVGNPGNLALLVIFEAIPVRCLCVSFLSVTCDFLCIFYFNPWQEDHRVTLNVYDLSQGLARQLSSSLLGKAIEAIWLVFLLQGGSYGRISGFGEILCCSPPR